MFPITMLTNAFTAPELMPGWLGSIADWNPLSATVSAARELFDSPGVGVGAGGAWIARHSMLMAIVWPLLLVATFMPLAIRRFGDLSR